MAGLGITDKETIDKIKNYLKIDAEKTLVGPLMDREMYAMLIIQNDIIIGLLRQIAIKRQKGV